MIDPEEGPGILDVRGGSFRLAGGALTTERLMVTNRAGRFEFSGGVLQATSLVISNGAPFVVGDGISAATLDLRGGVSMFSDGLVISSNATVRGCGTIVGSVINSGTMATNCAPAAPLITATFRVGNRTTVMLQAIPGATHVLEYNDSLSTSWAALLPGSTASGESLSLVDTNASAAMRFYRVRVE